MYEVVDAESFFFIQGDKAGQSNMKITKLC